MQEMRGLILFISDIRNARARDLEEKRINKELANIRQKFKEGKMNGYDKKKYVCKLLYIYILGWDVSFGHLEAVNLISSIKFSEKQIGYLAVTLLLNEDHDLLHLVVNSIRKDLLDHNELFNCLALHCIANVGGREMGEALSNDVHRLLVSPTSKTFVKKKAALTLLRIYRKFPDIIQREWAERLISLLDDPDLGVTLCVSSLLLALVQDNAEAYKGSYSKSVHRLHRMIIAKEYTQEYEYYKVPVPWLQVKLLRLLQYYPPTEDPTIKTMMREVLNEILENSKEPSKNVQQNNAQNAVLFEAISLAIHLDIDEQIIQRVITLLGNFIQASDANSRYLGLQTMAHLAIHSDYIEKVKSHLKQIIASLKDRDISVRRQCLDLLYSMCDTSNAKEIVGELLKYLAAADYAIREEMVLKIAILAEKYATEYRWYVDTTLQLVSMAGEYASDEVWCRIVQVVVNNEEIQEYTTEKALSLVKKVNCHESVVKVAGYILGEYGHLIANTAGCSPIEQFHALHMKFNVCTQGTKATLLSTYIKFINLFPEIREQIMEVLIQYSRVLDPELQQRACEYIALCSMQNPELLQTICEEMPPFPERTSPLLSRLHNKHGDTEDKRTWVIGGKSGMEEREAIGPLKRIVSNGQPKTPGTDDLNGLVFENGTKPKASEPNLSSAAHLSPDWEAGYNLLVLKNDGLLYTDGQIQVGVKSEYRGNVGRLSIFYANSTPVDFQSFTITINNTESASLSIECPNIPSTTLKAEGQTPQHFRVEALSFFKESPTIRISYLAGALQAVTLKLPVTLMKFMDKGPELNKEDFFARWKQIGGGSREAQVIGDYKGNGSIHLERHSTILKELGWSIYENVDPNPKNIVAASIVNTKAGRVGCLMRLEPDVDSRKYRLTIRATNDVVGDIFKGIINSIISTAITKK